ncbi:MAG: PepSY-like domain-containing protein [Prevotellaceae bacterium]|jgi:hypothetical protein|nr:PepSY-like domain-containing protein [Prevotellaceae bacterium]
MKLIRVLGVLAGLFFLVQTAFARINPAISDKYSNEEIAGMIKKYKNAHSHGTVPSAALHQKFQADFPKARDTEWETDRGIYEVEFEIKSRDCKAYYDAEGNLLMHVREIYRSELPAIVKNMAENKYPKYDFEDIEKIRRGSETFYKIEMERKSSDSEVKLLIGKDGVMLDELFDY